MNPTYQPILTIKVKANNDIPAYRFVRANGQLCNLEQRSIGVSEMSGVSGDLVPVISIGTCLVTAGGNINIGSDVISDAQGRAIQFTETGIVNGVALSSATAGKLVKILLK